jgi:hypothetical protein
MVPARSYAASIIERINGCACACGLNILIFLALDEELSLACLHVEVKRGLVDFWISWRHEMHMLGDVGVLAAETDLLKLLNLLLCGLARLNRNQIEPL